MTYSLRKSALGVLATVSSDRITRIQQGLQDLHMLPAGTQASLPDTAYALKQWAASQHLPTSYVVWNGSTLQIDNVLADRFAAAVTEARRNPGLTTSRVATTTPAYVQSSTKEDDTAPFVPSSTIGPSPSSSFVDRLRNVPWWGWAAGAAGVAAIGYVVMKKRKPVATMTANRRRSRRRSHRRRSLRRNRSSLSSARTIPYRRTSKPKRKYGKLRLLVRGRGKKMYVYPRRKRAEVLRGKVTITPNSIKKIQYFVETKTDKGWRTHTGSYSRFVTARLARKLRTRGKKVRITKRQVTLSSNRSRRRS